MRVLTRVLKSFLVVFFTANLLLVTGKFTLIANAACEGSDKSILGVPTWYKYLDSEPVAGKCKPIIDSSKDALPIGLALLEAGLTLGGIIAAVMVFIGGFKYVLSQGEPDKAAGGRQTVMNAVIGLVIVILATRIVSFIGSRLG